MIQSGGKHQWLLRGMLIALMAVFCMPAVTFAAIAHVGSDYSFGTLNSLTIANPSTAEGNVMIANFYQTGYDTNGPSLSGWTQLTSIDLGGTLERRATVLYKVAGASEPANYTFSISGAADGDIAVFGGSISAFSGVCTSTPIDATGTPQANNSTIITAPGITAVTDNAAVVFLAQHDNNSTVSSWATTAPGSLGEIVDATYNGSGSNDAEVGVAYAILATAGATGDGTATIDEATARYNGGVLIALRPTPDTPETTSNSPICEGSTLELSASTVDGDTYSWTGPNGFTSSDQNPTIENVTTYAFGTYYVTVTANDCTSKAGSTDVIVNPAPLGCDITAPSSVVFGSTGNTASTVATSGATYSWVILVDNVDMTGSLITAGAGTNQITWTAPASFTSIDIGVTVTTDQGCACENDPPVGGVSIMGTGGSGGSSIPTLSEWGMMILSLLLAGIAVGYLRKKKHLSV